MFCNQCGTQNPDDGKFCTRCGHSLTTSETQPGNFATTSNATFARAQTMAPAVTENRPTDGKAVASMILGILALTVFWILAGIPAVILGHLSKKSIRESAGRLKGEGMALAGLIMGYLSLAALPFILIVAAIAIPNLLRARMAANEASAVASVRTVITASISYKEMHPDVGYPVSLAELGANGKAGAGLIDEQLTAGQKSGYRFEYESIPAADGTRTSFFVRAIPVKRGNTGVREFCADERAVVRYAAQGSSCTAESEALD